MKGIDYNGMLAFDFPENSVELYAEKVATRDWTVEIVVALLYD